MPSDEEVIQRAGSLQAMTGLTEREFPALLPYFEPAYVAYRQDHTIEGQPRTSRRYSTYDTCPVPTMPDKLLFILTSWLADKSEACPSTLLRSVYTLFGETVCQGG